MPFIDLQDDFPSKKAIYRIKIKTAVGSERIAQAAWNPDKKGFIPIDDKLFPEEYIFAWERN